MNQNKLGKACIKALEDNNKTNDNLQTNQSTSNEE